MLPRSSQLDAKIAQESPTYGQDRPKCSPRASNQSPQDPKMWPKRCTFVCFYTSVIFRKITPKTTKNHQDSARNGLKMAILVPTRCQEVLNLTPRFAQKAQLMAKIAQESPTYGQDRPKSSPRASISTPQDPKMWPKRYSVLRFYTSAIFLKIAPKTTKNV